MHFTFLMTGGILILGIAWCLVPEVQEGRGGLGLNLNIPLVVVGTVEDNVAKWVHGDIQMKETIICVKF